MASFMIAPGQTTRGTRLVISGLFELKEALRNLPMDLRNDAQRIVEDTAKEAAIEIRNAYPEVTGNLKRGVRVEYLSNLAKFGAGAVVVSRAKHAYLFEMGSAARHYYSKGGVKHETGIMPAASPGRAFIPTIIRYRRMMNRRLAALLQDHGLAVVDDGGL